MKILKIARLSNSFKWLTVAGLALYMAPQTGTMLLTAVCMLLTVRLALRLIFQIAGILLRIGFLLLIFQLLSMLILNK